MSETGDPLFPRKSAVLTYEGCHGVNQDDVTITMRPCTMMGSKRIAKNLAVLCFAQFLFFMGFVALSNLQSTMNSKQGVGTDCQAAIYASSMVACLLLPELMIKSIGCKWAYALAVFCSVPYIAANYYPTWSTLMPSAILLGLAAAPMTTSISTYIDEMARRYRRFVCADDYVAVASMFYGIFSFTQSNNQIWGNLISYYVLQPEVEPGRNSSAPAEMDNCGVNFRRFPNGTGPEIKPPSDEQRYLLVTIFVASSVLSFLMIVLFLDPLQNDIDREQSTEGKSRTVLRRLAASARQALKLDQWLLVPLSIYCGLEVAFYASEFTQAFIACSWGIQNVGFVTIFYGVCGALMSVSVGPLVKKVSQMAVILLAAFINAAVCGLLFVWQPSPDGPGFYFVFAGLLGITDAIWWSQLQALYCVVFPENREAAFSNFFFWAFSGYFINFSYSSSLTIAVKINIVLIFLIVGTVLYVVGQVKIKCAAQAGYVTVA